METRSALGGMVMVNSLVDIQHGAAAGLRRRTGSFLGTTPSDGFYARSRRRRSGKAAATLLALLALGLSGCAGARESVGASQLSNQASLGLWRYLEPAVWHAAPRMELTVHQTSEPAPGVRRYILLSVRNETVDLTATRSGDGDAAVVESIQAKWRPFPNAAKERRLIEMITSRMRRLELGGGVAPG